MLSDTMRSCCNNFKLPAMASAGCTRGEKRRILRLPFTYPSDTTKPVSSVAEGQCLLLWG